MCHRRAGNRHYPVDQRLVVAHGLIDRVGGGHILHDSTRRHRQSSRRDFLAEQGLDQLLLTSLRIFHLKSGHLDTVDIACGIPHGGNCVGLIVLDAHYGPIHTGSAHQQLYS